MSTTASAPAAASGSSDLLSLSLDDVMKQRRQQKSSTSMDVDQVKQRRFQRRDKKQSRQQTPANGRWKNDKFPASNKRNYSEHDDRFEDDNAAARIFISGLSGAVDDATLKTFVDAVGLSQSIRRIKNNAAAIVQYASADAAQLAIQRLNGLLVAGHQVVVELPRGAAKRTATATTATVTAAAPVRQVVLSVPAVAPAASNGATAAVSPKPRRGGFRSQRGARRGRGGRRSGGEKTAAPTQESLDADMDAYMADTTMAE